MALIDYLEKKLAEKNEILGAYEDKVAKVVELKEALELAKNEVASFGDMEEHLKERDEIKGYIDEFTCKPVIEEKIEEEHAEEIKYEVIEEVAPEQPVAEEIVR